MVGILARTAAIAIERKRSEEALRESEEWLRAIFAASRDGILVEDNERIVYVNKSYADLFGYDKTEELIGQHISVVISTEDVERLLEFGRQRSEGGLPEAVYEFKGKRKDGASVDLEASVSTSQRSEGVLTSRRWCAISLSGSRLRRHCTPRRRGTGCSLKVTRCRSGSMI